MKRIYNYIVLSVLLGLVATTTSCQRDEEVVVSTMMTNEPASISARVAQISFQINYDGTITNCGVCYSRSPKPTLEDYVIEYGDSLPEMCVLTDLTPETKYHVRSFIQKGTDVLYGNEIVFTTTAPLISSDHEYVDMGLSVMWATCNVGADYPEDYGYFFAWGETQQKSQYTWANYKYGSSATSILKYSESANYGVVDNKVILDLWDDAAYMNWGGNWRMPTREEVEELIENTTWTWTNQNGVNGCRVTSKINYNSFFLPATGYRRDSEYLGEGTNVGMWTSTLWENGAPYGTGMAYNTTTTSTPEFYGFSRYNGDPVRPVLGKNIEAPTLGIPIVKTEPVPREIGVDFIKVRYKILSDNGSMFTEYGVCYSTTPNPTINDSKISYTNNLGLGAYWCTLMNLQEGTTYYIRAYAINQYGIGYGEEIALTTPTRLFENGYEYVDMGLSVKWATCNVGAKAVDEYGDYFAWGEITPKTEYTWANYLWCAGTETTMTKYCTDSQYGKVDNKSVLELSDDAAQVNLRGHWRMPTYEEINELGSNTTWYWTTLDNGVSGYTLVSKINQHSIFLPAAGYFATRLGDINAYGYYWSSSLRNNNSSCGTILGMEANKGGFSGGYYRYYGRSVRGVVDDNLQPTVTQNMFDGTPESRGFYTPSEVIDAYGSRINIGDSIKVGGVISRWFRKSSTFDTYRSVSYFISDGVNEFEFYNSYSLNKDSFAIYEYTDDYNAICIDVNNREFHIGDTVVGAGLFTIYNGTYELNTNCYLIDWRSKAQ